MEIKKKYTKHRNKNTMMDYSCFLKKVIMPIADKTMNTKIMYYYQVINEMAKYRREEIICWQNQKLKKLIKHAYNNTIYYKNLFDNLNINPDAIQSKDDLFRLPVLTKETIINNYRSLIPNNINKLNYKESATGGSTGDPMKFLLDLNSWSFSNANAIVNWEKMGYEYGDKYLALGSTSIFVDEKLSFKHRLYYQIKRKIPVSGINMSDNVCEKFIYLIRNMNIKYIYGYASSIYLLAKYIIEHDLNLSLNCCFPTSEILLENYRKTIKKAFRCRIMDCYGAYDGGVTAFEFKHGFYEVGYNTLIIQKNKDTNNIGSAILTDLLNFSMPLVNYQLGDEYCINNRMNSQYNYNGQLLNTIIGRTSDIIRLRNGRILTGPGFTILFKDLPVESYSISQLGENEIECLVKKMPDFSESHERLIKNSMQNQAGDSCKINIKYVKKFTTLQNGKRKFFYN